MLFVIIIPARQRMILLLNKLRKQRGERKVSNQLIQSCIGKICTITTGSFGSSYNKVKIVEVIDNWIRIESKGKQDLINSDYVQCIKIISQ